MKTYLLSLLLVFGAAVNAHAVEDRKELVVLLHGIGHSKWNMIGAERALKAQGYETLNISYPSRSHNIAALAGFLKDRLAQDRVWDGRRKVHFVTHSMGGLVARTYLDSYRTQIPEAQLGRVVMIAPPNGGSEVANMLQNVWPYQWMFGSAGQELTTHTQSKHRVVPYYDLGIIAGSRGWVYLMGNMSIEGAHDGRVSVEKTRLAGMKDHLVILATHSFISWSAVTHEQVISFLKDGVFQHGT